MIFYYSHYQRSLAWINWRIYESIVEKWIKDFTKEMSAVRTNLNTWVMKYLYKTKECACNL